MGLASNLQVQLPQQPQQGGGMAQWLMSLIPRQGSTLPVPPEQWVEIAKRFTHGISHADQVARAQEVNNAQWAQKLAQPIPVAPLDPRLLQQLQNMSIPSSQWQPPSGQ